MTVKKALEEMNKGENSWKTQLISNMMNNDGMMQISSLQNMSQFKKFKAPDSSRESELNEFSRRKELGEMLNNYSDPYARQNSGSVKMNGMRMNIKHFKESFYRTDRTHSQKNSHRKSPFPGIKKGESKQILERE